jgi:hypothetical protein
MSLNCWSFFCKTSEQTIRQLEDSLESLKDIIDHVQPNSEMQTAIREIKERSKVIESMISILAVDVSENTSSDVSKTLDMVKTIEDRLKRKELFDWVSTDDFRQKHRDVSSACQKGTGTWILQSDVYLEWVVSDIAGTLWCYGIPRSGKTVLFSAMVDSLMGRGTSTSSSVCAVYFDYKEASRYTVQKIFLGMLRQLCEQSYHHPEAMKALGDLNELCSKQNKRMPNLEERCTLLTQISAMYQDTFLCFNALNELPDPCRHILLKSLKTLRANFNIENLLTSREHITLKQESTDLILCRVSATSFDLGTYLNARIDEAESDCLA